MNDPKLSAEAKIIISNLQNDIFFSIVSDWEIVIKSQIGKLPLPETPDLYLPSRIAHYGFQTLLVEMLDVLRIWQLETHHKDPFDRLLIAQSQTHNLPVLTADGKFSLYDVTVIW